MAVSKRAGQSPSLYYNNYDAPRVAIPLISSIPLLASLYRWHRSQYHQQPNTINTTMEQTPLLSQHSSGAQGPTSFTKFKELPPELRIKIWHYAMPEPRTVIVKSPYARPGKRAPRSLEEALPEPHQHPGEAETWYSPTPVPALLHVSAEARHEALKRYSLSLGAAEGGGSPRVYVDLGRDAVYFGHAELRAECAGLWGRTHDLARVRRLAVVAEGAWRVLRWKRVGLDALRHLIFVHGTERGEPEGPLPLLVEDVVEDELPARPQSQSQLRGNEDQEQQQEHRGEGLELLFEERRERAGEGDGEEQRRRRPDDGAAAAAAALDPVNKRMQAAREEIDTLMAVLPTQWEREPAVSTAVFRECDRDEWFY
ncbi:hypothetical protein GGS23DRAFT_547387 [Durotheca rogersii]|uniref:uncharacterized protein n=1 Tax=Durotheca rogersii TaxID=419775 RepID=UPI0022202D6C|nr:uncharacterized protein GGS23DRAFT_547387 [Durotheca rogersii]KAI5867223.1 hypothetical protein GGS23DRAFT_547387 [Durotheca rogersii]